MFPRSILPLCFGIASACAPSDQSLTSIPSSNLVDQYNNAEGGSVEVWEDSHELGFETSTSSTEDTDDTNADGLIDNSGTVDLPFNLILDTCLGLDESDCVLDLDDNGNPHADCVNEATQSREEMHDALVNAAQDYLGDSTITMADIEDGAVPAIVEVRHSYHSANYNSEPVWSNYAWILINFGDDPTVFDDMFTPYDQLEVPIMRCIGFRHSLGETQPSDTDELTAYSVSNSAIGANNDYTHGLGMHDYANSSGSLRVYGMSYDVTSPQWVLSPAYNAIDDEVYKIISMAASVAGSGNSEVILVY